MGLPYCTPIHAEPIPENKSAPQQVSHKTDTFDAPKRLIVNKTNWNRVMRSARAIAKNFTPRQTNLPSGTKDTSTDQPSKKHGQESSSTWINSPQGQMRIKCLDNQDWNAEKESVESWANKASCVTPSKIFTKLVFNAGKEGGNQESSPTENAQKAVLPKKRLRRRGEITSTEKQVAIPKKKQSKRKNLSCAPPGSLFISVDPDELPSNRIQIDSHESPMDQINPAVLPSKSLQELGFVSKPKAKEPANKRRKKELGGGKPSTKKRNEPCDPEPRLKKRRKASVPDDNLLVPPVKNAVETPKLLSPSIDIAYLISPDCNRTIEPTDQFRTFWWHVRGCDLTPPENRESMGHLPSDVRPPWLIWYDALCNVFTSDFEDTEHIRLTFLQLPPSEREEYRKRSFWEYRAFIGFVKSQPS